MRRISTFFYGIGQGVWNIFRNRLFSLASIGTMSACLFLFGVFYTVIANFNHVVAVAENKVGITVFFDEGLSAERIREIGEEIASREEVTSVVYTSAEEAWESYRTRRLDPELAASFGDDNPLADSASYTVYLSDVSKQAELVEYASALYGVRRCNDIADIAAGLGSFNAVVGYVSGGVIAVLVLVAAFLISMTVSTGVAVRRTEISIMKLIGASDFFIRIPFLVEGVLIGLIGAGIPLVVLRFVYTTVTEAMIREFGPVLETVSLLDCSSVMRSLIPISLLIGVGIGFVGSSATLRHQLIRIELEG